ncbi:MAG: hypothetical protein DRJ10_02580, partial [Bacteroidetes bacterium]
MTSSSIKRKKILKCFLGILISIVTIIAIAIIFIYQTAFKLEEWEYPDCKKNIAKTIPDRPIILLLVAEDMSQRVGAFGDSVAQTPNIDKLASQGIRYFNV